MTFREKVESVNLGIAGVKNSIHLNANQRAALQAATHALTLPGVEVVVSPSGEGQLHEVLHSVYVALQPFNVQLKTHNDRIQFELPNGSAVVVRLW